MSVCERRGDTRKQGIWRNDGDLHPLAGGFKNAYELLNRKYYGACMGYGMVSLFNTKTKWPTVHRCPEEQTSVKSKCKFKAFLLTCCLQTGGHVVLASICYTVFIHVPTSAFITQGYICQNQYTCCVSFKLITCGFLAYVLTHCGLATPYGAI